MARDFKYINIDGDKLRHEILKKGYTLRGASEQIGKSRSYVQSLCDGNRISATNTILVEKVLGIPVEKYAIPDEEDEEVQIDGNKENLQGKYMQKMLIKMEQVLFNLTSVAETNSKIKSNSDIVFGIAREMGDTVELLQQTLKTQQQIMQKMDYERETQETILKKLIGLEEVVYKGTKRALNE